MLSRWVVVERSVLLIVERRLKSVGRCCFTILHATFSLFYPSQSYLTFLKHKRSRARSQLHSTTRHVSAAAPASDTSPDRLYAVRAGWDPERSGGRPPCVWVYDDPGGRDHAGAVTSSRYGVVGC
jgi:hypothetical protein